MKSLVVVATTAKPVVPSLGEVTECDLKTRILPVTP